LIFNRRKIKIEMSVTREKICLEVPQELQASTALDFSFRDVTYTIGKGKSRAKAEPLMQLR